MKLFHLSVGSLLFAVVSVSGLASTTRLVAADVGLPADFEANVLRDMEKWHAPGMGLTIVKDGKTLIAKGFGVKSVKSKKPVLPNTVFQAGSTSKAFASMALAMLADDGKLNWTDTVKKHLPELKIKDKYVEENLTIEDALTHRSGVSGISNLNMFMARDLPDAVALLADTEQTAGFRTEWAYNNTTFGLSGLIVARISGMPYHEFVKKRILEPLGMHDTLMLDDEVKARDNRAEAHQYFEGTQYEIPYPYIEYSQSAGMMNSTPQDMEKWLKFLLAGGKWQGKQLVSERTSKPCLSQEFSFLPQTPIRRRGLLNITSKDMALHGSATAFEGTT